MHVYMYVCTLVHACVFAHVCACVCVERWLQEWFREGCRDWQRENYIPDSQCGFRKSRSCTDMTFVVRQLTEKAQEHRMKRFTIFIDLKKAHDSVPRKALWMVVKKLGVSDMLIDNVRAFHEKMEESENW